jgi:hypothetical protein
MLVTPNLARAHFAGVLESGVPVRIAITTVESTGHPTAVTIWELGSDRVRQVISLSPEYSETEAVELMVSRNTRRIIIEVDPVPGAAARVAVSQFGAPVFPDETISEDKRYVLDPRR